MSPPKSSELPDPIQDALDWALEHYTNAVTLGRAVTDGDLAPSRELDSVQRRLFKRAAERADAAARLLKMRAAHDE